MNNGKKELYANLSSWCLLNFKLYICLFAVNFVEPELFTTSFKPTNQNLNRFNSNNRVSGAVC